MSGVENLEAGGVADLEGRMSYLNDEDRLKAYNTILHGCNHLWSKGKPQWDKIGDVLDILSGLAENDPYFLAHLTSYAVRKLDHRDLQVAATFASSLSDADGTPIMLGSRYNKPNLRVVAQAALQELDPKRVLRVLSLANRKMTFGSKREATHFSKHLRTAVKKYLRFRESNPKALQSLYSAGWKNTVQNLYRSARLAPSEEAARILRWKQKSWGAGVSMNESVFDFSGLCDLEVAHKIRDENLKVLGTLAALDRKMSPVIAAALLEQCSPDQTVVLTNMFEEEGLLADPEVRKVYADKIRSAVSTLDRVERLNTVTGEQTKKMMKEAKAARRKEDVGDLGKVFIHIDNSPSMEKAVQLAKEAGSTIAECIGNPEENFHWGLFNDRGYVLPKPQSFEKDAFMHALYGVRCCGCGTNCLALYQEARRLGCDTDIYITDQVHNHGNVSHMLSYIERMRELGYSDPKMAVVITVAGGYLFSNMLVRAFQAAKIPVVELKPEQIRESALVSQTIRTALLGQTAVIDEIINTPLLKLPRWWGSV